MNEDRLSLSGSPLLTATITDYMSVSTAIITSVAAVSNSPPEELPPLYEAIDPEALQSLLQPASDGLVAFHYHEYTVCVTTDERVSIYDHGS